jgi:hypothetical protein
MEAADKGFRRMVRSSAELTDRQISRILYFKWHPYKSERLERTAAKMRATQQRIREANKRASRQNFKTQPEFNHKRNDL